MVESISEWSCLLVAPPPLRRRPQHKLLWLLWAVGKVSFQIIQLLWILLVRIGPHELLLLQNPPSMPTLAVSWLVSRLRGSRFIVDWHNFGYTILALGLRNASHPFVRFSHWFERFFGRLADQHFCVTRAMRTWLHRNWGIRAEVLYDRPPTTFRRLDIAERHEFFERVVREGSPKLSYDSDRKGKGYDVLAADDVRADDEMLILEDGNEFTESDPRTGEIRLKADRPALLISSTSYTPDEDFTILLSAVENLEQRLRRNPELPNMVFVVTGKGP